MQVMFIPDKWETSWIVIPEQVDLQVNQDSLSVHSIGSHTAEEVQLARSYEYEVIVTSIENAPVERGIEGILMLGQGEYATSQRVIGYGALHVSHYPQSKSYYTLGFFGMQSPEQGVHMPKLYKYRFDMGDGTFKQLLLSEWELSLFDKNSYIDRIYGKGV